MTNPTRRDFLKTTAKATAGALLGADSAEKLLATMPAATALGEGGGGQKDGASLSLPKGGGAIKGIGEKFSPNPFTGTGNFSVPIAVSPGRGGMQPALNLQYSTGQGNSPFGLGWSLDVPFISRKTDKGIPVYDDDKDVFLLHGSEDLVPYLEDKNNTGQWTRFDYPEEVKNILKKKGYAVVRYRPRTEGSYARIEFWKGNDRSFWIVTDRNNTCTIYGYNETTQLYFRDLKEGQPIGKKKIYQWMPEFTFEPRGNVLTYVYKKDYGKDILDNKDKAPSIFESHRKGFNQDAYQIYLEKIHYSNKQAVVSHHQLYSVLDTLSTYQPQTAAFENLFLFSVVFDYGELGKENRLNENIYAETTNQNWASRTDPFSSYKAGFDMRTYRLCKRVMIFHRDPNEAYKTRLVRSTDLEYTPNGYNGMNMLTKVTQRGYRYVNDGQEHCSEEFYVNNMQGGVESSVYAIKSLPPLEFNYSEFKPKKQQFKPITADNRDLTGDPLSNPNMALVDLYGTGLNDLLLTSAVGYFYWTNKGEGHFSSRRTMKQMPNNVQLNGAGISFGDMAGDGQPDLLVHEGNQWGFYENNGNAGWQNFKPYKKQPSFDINDSRSRLMDLTGDGKTDLLRIDDNYFYYFPCIGEEGWDTPKRVRRAHDLAEFPDVDFSNPRVKLADMTGDGLQDIVLVHDGRIDYWANMGYGKFSRRITLKNAPRFGYGFDPKRLLFADIDGSGTADMIYCEGSRVRVWFNQSGNAWSEEVEINGTPSVTDTHTMQIADLYGCGCQGLLWSSVYRGNTESNYRFMDFTGGVKPNLLTEVNDNMGITTKVSYKPSTHFYLEDKKRGREWATALPFPVQCLEKVEHIDHISKTKLVTRYAYHHGYYDGREREFRGFAFVEQWDTEGFDGDFSNNDKGYHVPPVLTKMWFHTGAYPNEKVREAYSKWSSGKANFDVHELFKKDYYNKGKDLLEISDAVFEGYNGKLHQKGVFEAYRALRGQMLRQEVYAEDGSNKAKIPYTVATTSAKVKIVQPKVDNEFAVFRTDAYESISYHYERKADNPRISQDLTLLVDDYGNVKQSLSIVYPARTTELKEQKQIYATFTNALYLLKSRKEGTDLLHGTHFNRNNVLCEKQVFEVHGLQFDWANPKKFNPSDFNFVAIKADESEKFIVTPKHHHEEITESGYILRRLAWERHYFKDYFNATKVDETPLKKREFLGCYDFRIIDLLGLPYESYQATFHESQIHDKEVFGTEVTDTMLINAGYIKTLPKSESDPSVKNSGYWWMPSGQQGISDVAFWQPVFTIDPFGNQTSIEYEGRECLLMKSLTDAVGNTIAVKNDYTTLQPSELIDANGVISKVVFDAMGAVVATGIIGTNKEGDALNEFVVPYEYDEKFRDYFKDENIEALLKNASSVMLYDLWRGISLKGRDKYVNQPQAVFTAAREKHHHIEQIPIIQRKISYFDGLDRELQTKLSFEPESTDKKWLTSGWKTYNNKGKPVRQYEPFFSPSFDYKSNEEKGVSSVLFYDPLDRVVCTIHPNGTYEKVVFDAWQQTTYDVNDTLGKYNKVTGAFEPLTPISDDDISGYIQYFNEPYSAWSSNNAAQTKQVKKHADTPTTTYLDTLGRPFKTVQIHTIDGITRQEFVTTNELDIQGNILSITDPRGVKCFEHQFDMLKRQLVVDSKDAGKKILFTDVAGQPIWTKDAKGNMTLSKYDALRRPTELWVKEGSNTEGGYFLAQKTIYGEAVDKPYFKGKVWKTYDGAGMAENRIYDFKGNVTEAQRRLLEKKKEQVKWAKSAKPLDVDIAIVEKHFLEDKTYQSIFDFDALGRVVSATLPDRTVKTPQYNKSNLLKSLIVKDKDGKKIPFVKSIEYNAKGQREKIQYGNNVITTYKYEDETYRLTQLYSVRTTDSCILQDLNYSYDPVGNITSIKDDASDPVFNCNQKVEAVSTYQYDSLYRLIEATGREHESIKGSPETNKSMNPKPQPLSNKQAMVNYTEQYEYDKAGNFTKKTHTTTNKSWIVTQVYDANSNRIVSSETGSDKTIYNHDKNGNITSMYADMAWNYANQLISVTKTVGEKIPQIHYQYDAQGNRIVKTVGKSQRIYLGDYEVYNEGGKTSETVHVMDDKARIATIDTSTEYPKAIRYQLSNHLGSATVEVNENGFIISYEEYYAYGGTAVFGFEKDSVSTKRYRYSGKERDEETGLYYYGARYYAPWMGRWCSCDAIGNKDGNNIYQFNRSNPIILIDPNGKAVTLVTAGAGFILGFVIGAGVEAGRQLWKGENFDMSKVVNSGAGGAVAGGLAGATLGISLIAEGGFLAGAAVAGGTNAAGGSITRGLNGEEQSVKATAIDATIGVAFFGVGKAVGAAYTGIKKAVDMSHITEGLDQAVTEGAKEGVEAMTPKFEIPLSKKASEFKVTETLKTKSSAKKVIEIAGELKAGEKIPPIQVVEFENNLFVVDGHHRLMAARILGKELQYEIVPPNQLPGSWKSIDDVINSSLTAKAHNFHPETLKKLQDIK